MTVMSAPRPSTVLSLSTRIGLESAISPLTRKRIHAGPLASAAARSDPGPSSASVVTSTIGPPAPPVVKRPKPTRSSRIRSCGASEPPPSTGGPASGAPASAAAASPHTQ